MAEPASFPDHNPLRPFLPRSRVPDPCAVVLFGATGDLMSRKLAPALYRLAIEGQLPSEYAIVGFGRRDWSDDQFREELKKPLSKEGARISRRHGPSLPPMWSSTRGNSTRSRISRP